MSPMEFMLQNTDKIIGVYRKSGSQKETYQAVSNLPECPPFNSFKTYLKPLAELSAGYEKKINQAISKIAVKDGEINRLRSQLEGLQEMFESIRKENDTRRNLLKDRVVYVEKLENRVKKLEQANKDFLKERDQTVKRLEKELAEFELQLAKVSKPSPIPKSIEGWTLREDVRKGSDGKSIVYLQANITRDNKRYSIYIGRKDKFSLESAVEKIRERGEKIIQTGYRSQAVKSVAPESARPAKVRIYIDPDCTSGNRKDWYKPVTKIDTSQKGGYAFLGDFLSQGEHDLPLGSVVIGMHHGGSVKHSTRSGVVYQVTETGLESVSDFYDWKEEALSFRDKVNECLTKR